MAQGCGCYPKASGELVSWPVTYTTNHKLGVRGGVGSSGGGVAGDDGKLRVEEGDGEVTQGARVGKNLTALGEELVEVCGEESDRRMGRGRHFW